MPDLSTASSLIETISKGENETCEFKQSWGRECIETLCAFANHKGGHLLIGLSDLGEITGVKTNPETLQNWLNQIKLSTEPSLSPEAEIAELESKELAVLSLSPCPVKPVACKGRYYMRRNNSNHTLSLSEIADLHMKSLNTSWDSYTSADTPMEAVSLDKVNRFIERVNHNAVNPITDSPLTVLTKFELLRNNQVTNAARLLFASDTNIAGTVELGRFKDEVTIIDAATLRNDLISQCDDILQFILKNIRKEYIIDNKLERTEVWQYPLPFLRESVVNMVVHRDYHRSQDSSVKIFDDRIEFYNPGPLMEGLTVENLFSGNYVSAVRNKLIASIFKELNLIDKYGSGIKRMQKSLKDAELPPLRIEELQGGVRLTAFCPPEKVDRKERWTKEKGGQKRKVDKSPSPEQKGGQKSDFTGERWTKENGKQKKKVDRKPPSTGGQKTEYSATREQLLKLLKDYPKASRNELSQLLSIAPSAISKHLKVLKDTNRIRRIGGAKGGHWEITN